MNKKIIIGLNFIILLVIGLFIAVFIQGIKFTYYHYFPLSYFVDYQKLDFQDYKIGDDYQILYGYRKVRFDVVADFYHKVFCNGYNKVGWNYVDENILLPKTQGIEKVKINMIILDLPPGECIVKSKIAINIRGAIRFKTLEDSFTVFE